MKIVSLRSRWLNSSFLILLLVAGVFLLRPHLPAKTADLGPWCMLPCVLAVAWTFATHRIIEAVVLGAISGFALCTNTPAQAMTSFSKGIVKAMRSEDIAWLFVVCGLMGGLISIIAHSGGATAFGVWTARRAKSSKVALLWAWVLGCVIFIDDYLNSMTVGSTLSRLTDHHRTPREMLAYVADSTAAPLCVLVPFTTWAAFAGRLLVTNGWTEPGVSEIGIFAKTIPYNLYAWIAAVIVPLVIVGIIPKWGAMRKAYERVAAGGPLAPDGSAAISLLPQDRQGAVEENHKGRMWDFFLPLLVLVLATVWLDCDLQSGVLVAVPFTFLLFAFDGALPPDRFWNALLEGIASLVQPMLLMVVAFVFADMNERLGFVSWAINCCGGIMNAATLPFVVFIVLAITEFVTGSNWGMYVVALPIVIPLARQFGVDMPLAVAACLSAGVFGSHVSFCSDATVISSAACGCDNFHHAVSQLPYGLFAAVLSGVGFLVLGYLKAPV